MFNIIGLFKCLSAASKIMIIGLELSGRTHAHVLLLRLGLVNHPTPISYPVTHVYLVLKAIMFLLICLDGT